MTPRLCLDASTVFRSLDAQTFLDQKPEGPALPEMRNTRSDQREAASSPPGGVLARKIRKISRPLVLKYTHSTVQQSQSPPYPVPSTQQVGALPRAQHSFLNTTSEVLSRSRFLAIPQRGCRVRPYPLALCPSLCRPLKMRRAEMGAIIGGLFVRGVRQEWRVPVP